MSSAQEQDVSVQYNAGSKTLTITIKIASIFFLRGVRGGDERAEGRGERDK